MALSIYTATELQNSALVEYTSRIQFSASGTPNTPAPKPHNLIAQLLHIRKFSLTVLKEGVAQAGLKVSAYSPKGELLDVKISAVDGAVTLLVDQEPVIDILVENPAGPPDYNRMYRRGCATIPYLVR